MVLAGSHEIHKDIFIQKNKLQLINLPIKQQKGRVS